jgi:hypothetical protein
MVTNAMLFLFTVHPFQLWRQGVWKGDILLAVDSRPVKGLSLKVVKAMVEGPADTVVQLSLQRSTGERFEARAMRTYILADDIQMATYGELLELIDAPGDNFHRQSQGPEEPSHELKSMHDRLCNRIVGLKEADPARTERQLQLVQQERDGLANKLEENYRQGEKIIKDLRDTLVAANLENESLKAELAELRSTEMTSLRLTFKPSVAPLAARGMPDFEHRLAHEVCVLLDIADEAVVSVQCASTEYSERVGAGQDAALRVDVLLLPEGAGEGGAGAGRTAKELSLAILTQVSQSRVLNA